MTDLAIKADFVDTRRVKSRGVLQIIVEVDIEREQSVMETLGWPKPAVSLPVAIARLQAFSEAPKSAQRKLSQEAHLWCNRTDFQQWLGVSSFLDAKAKLYHLCQISSLSELDISEPAALDFKDTVSRFEYEWKKKPPAP